MISAETIEQIKNKADIVNIISEYVPLNKRGKNFIALCPFHSEKTPSFTVSPDKHLFHCFGCNEGGNVFAFIMKIENVDFGEAIEILANKLNIPIKRTAGSSRMPQTYKNQLLDILNTTLLFYKDNLTKHPEVLEYLTKRGLSPKTIQDYSIGYATAGWSETFNHLLQKGFSPANIEKTGLILKREKKEGYYDRFRGRIMFPIFTLRGQVVAFGGRAFVDQNEVKYINSPDTPVYSKGNLLYGLNFAKEAIKREGFAIFVEGYMDLISVHQAGAKNCIAVLGTALTSNQAKQLKRFTNQAVLAFDSDQAGKTAADRNSEILKQFDFNVKIATFKGAKDPDEFIKKHGTKGLVSAIIDALPWIECKLDQVLLRYNISDVDSKVRAAREIASILVKEKDQIALVEYTKLAASKLKVSPETLSSEIKRLGFYGSRDKHPDNLKKVTGKPESKIIVAEQVLLKAALENQTALSQIKEKIDFNDFSDSLHRQIAEVIFTVDIDQGKNIIDFLMNNLPQEETKKIVSKISLLEVPNLTETEVIEDCINAIKSYHLQNKINQTRNNLVNAESQGQTSEVAKLAKELKEYNDQLRSIMSKV